MKKEEVGFLVTALVDEMGLHDVESIIGGSWRRGLDESGDIELILVGDDEGSIHATRDQIKKHFGTLKTKDEPKMSGLFDGVQFDLHTCRRAHLGSMLLHATGSWQFNKFLRTRAIMAGYKLNQYGLYDRGSDEPVVQSPDEQVFFEVLGLPFIPPTNRSVGCTFRCDCTDILYRLDEGGHNRRVV